LSPSPGGGWREATGEGSVAAAEGRPAFQGRPRQPNPIPYSRNRGSREFFCVKFPRCSGILLHPTSLPGRFGIGDFGAEALHFVDFLGDTGQRLWQVLPLGPTGYGDSPYQCFSAFAGNPLLISLEKLSEDGLLTESEARNQDVFQGGNVDFPAVIAHRRALWPRVLDRFEAVG